MTATCHHVRRMLVFFSWVAPGVSVKQLQESPVKPEGYIVHRVWMGFASDASHLFHKVLVLITVFKPELAGDIMLETNLQCWGLHVKIPLRHLLVLWLWGPSQKCSHLKIPLRHLLVLWSWDPSQITVTWKYPYDIYWFYDCGALPKLQSLENTLTTFIGFMIVGPFPKIQSLKNTLTTFIGFMIVGPYPKTIVIKKCPFGFVIVGPYPKTTITPRDLGFRLVVSM